MALSSPKHFPRPETADLSGLVAVTRSLDEELLVDAYSHGLFPWSEDPVRWYSPDPRAIFVGERLHLPRRLGKIMRHAGLTVSFDTAFTPVMQSCASTHAAEGEWISEGFVRAYSGLHARGNAHSVEVWQGGELVGGLYGVQIHGLFSGESMFHRVSNASKVAFAYLVAQLSYIGVPLLDAQVINAHTARLGAVLVRRSDYLWLLEQALRVRPLGDGEPWPAVPVALPPGGVAMQDA